MKNNIQFFLFILIFNCLINLSAKSNEPFKFDVTEIEIIDNGNTIKGIKGGVVTTDSGLKIEANTFVYDKMLNILNAKDTPNQIELFTYSLIRSYFFSKSEQVYFSLTSTL